MDKRKPSYIVGGNVNWYSHWGKQYGDYFKHRATIRSSNLTLGIYMDKVIVWKDTPTPMFIAALFTITRTWKQPKCPLTEEWVKKMIEYYSAIKRNEIGSFADSWIDLEIVIQSEVSQNEKNKYCVISLKYGI